MSPCRLTDWIPGQTHHRCLRLTESLGNRARPELGQFLRNLSADDLEVLNPCVVVTTRLSE